jgi:hypothetical protein
MRLPHYISTLALLILYFRPECRAQENDLGIGMVIPPGGDHMHAVIYAKPNVASDTIATLAEWQYTFHGESEKVRAYLVGFEKYDYWGLPILSITKDSSWAHVSVESSDGTKRTKGWVNLRTPNTTIRIWAEFLATKSMVLRTDKPLRFYSKPDKNAQLNIKLFRFRSPFDEYSYLLKPIRREGRWLLVELQTPFLPCGNDDAIEKDPSIQPRTIKVWIQYIDERGRPLVRAPMMC